MGKRSWICRQGAPAARASEPVGFIPWFPGEDILPDSSWYLRPDKRGMMWRYPPTRLL